MQGADLSPVIRGKSESGPDAAYLQIFGPFLAGGVEHGWRGLRTERYLYARTAEAPWLLYDLAADRYELNNLVSDPGSASTLAELDADLAQWMERTGDNWSYDWKHPIEDRGRLYRHETFYTVEEFMEWAERNPSLADL